MNHDVLDVFSSFPTRLTAAAEVAGPALPGEWSAAEIVRHLIAVEEEVWSARLAQIAAQDEPQWYWTEPGRARGLDGAPLTSIIAVFTAARAMTVDTVCALDDAGWGRAGIHAKYGRLDVAGLLRLAADHDTEHLLAIPGRSRSPGA